jgi:TolA-binding protein
MRLPVAAVLLSMAATGCATKADVDAMKSSVQTDLEEIRAGQLILLAQIRGGLDSLDAGLDSLDAAGIRRETTGRGEFERRVGQLEDLFAQVLEITEQNNQRLNDLYETQVSRGSRVLGAPTADAELSRASRAAGNEEPSQFYAMALEMYNRGNLETARGAFRNFLIENGDHELAPDAQYYVARTFEDAEDVGSALAEYQRVTELYPDSNRASAALYRRGFIEAARGNTALARQLFTQIESGYSNSPEAMLARQELKKLSG